MTPIDQAEALLKAAEIVAMDAHQFTDQDSYQDYYDAHASRSNGKLALARALIEKQAALEEAVGLLKITAYQFEYIEKHAATKDVNHAEDVSVANKAIAKAARQFLARQGAESKIKGESECPK